MRPQIRSIPLSEIECPQFTWAIRNNSKNISTILQPDFAQRHRECDFPAEKQKAENEYSYSGKAMSCKCLDETFKPSLFSHPATCVCSDDPCPPRDEVYRHYDIKLADQAISDIMEDIILKNMVLPPSPPRICKDDKWFKKTMISSHTTERLPLEENNISSQCCYCRMQYGICKHQNKWPDQCKYFKRNYVKSSDDRQWNTNGNLHPKALNELMNSYVCENENLLTSKNFEGGFCNCDARSVEYFCKSDVSECESPKNGKSESIIETDNINIEIENDSSSAYKKNDEQIQNEKIESQRTASIEKSLEEHEVQQKQPTNLTIERFEISQVNPYKEDGDENSENTKNVENNSLDMNTYFRNFKYFNSQSSPKSNSKFINSDKNAHSNMIKEQKNIKLPKKKTLSTGVHLKISKPVQKISQKYPWNFNNQVKNGDLSNNRSVHKNSKDMKISRKVDVQNKFMRSRAGEDFGDSTERSEPVYFEDTPNLISGRMRDYQKTEENIQLREERRDEKALGKLRVQLWHEKLDESVKNCNRTFNIEDEKGREQQKSNHMNNDEYQIEGSTIDSIRHYQRKYLQEKKLNRALIPFENSYDPPHNKRKYLCKDGCHLSTIFEEYQEKKDCILPKKNRDLNETEPKQRISGKYQKFESGSDQNNLQYNRQGIIGNLGQKSVDENFDTFNEICFRRDKIVEDSQNFRQQEFFDSHSIKPCNQDAPEHICIHRFTEGDRLYPRPLNSNELGISCCIRCDQPTKIDKTSFSDQSESGKNGRNVRNIRHQSKPIFIGSGNSLMKMKLGPEHENLVKTQKNIQRKNNYYSDSLALRHQMR